MLRALLTTAAVATLLASPTVAQSPVTVTNASRPTGCAEEDNVTVTLAGGSIGIGAFTLTALHPPYAGQLDRDSTAPDFRACDFTADPTFAFEPRTVVLHDGERWRLVGHAFTSFWRPVAPPVSVSGEDGRIDTSEADLHLLQLFTKAVSPPVEVVVLYPADGYWRVKPLPPPQLADSAYGSSFLIGPIERDGRPLVRLDAIGFEPSRNRFQLAFAAGGTASLTVAQVTAERTELAITLSSPIAGGQPFAALRSMFVSAEVADVAEAGWQAADGAWRVTPILDFGTAEAVAVRFGRTLPSRHNTSAPDLLFGDFRPVRE